MVKADCHFHSSHSDGDDPIGIVRRNLIEQGVQFATLTDHDLVNADFARTLQESGIESLPASEISTHFFSGETKMSLHMTAYAPEFSERALAMLENTREGKSEKVHQQVNKLASIGYPVSYGGLVAWATAKGYNPTCLNNYHLSLYVYSIAEAADRGDRDQGRKKPNRPGFLSECLTRTGRNPIGAVEIHEYEPTVAQAAERVGESGGIIAIAHPNFSWGRYGDVEGLQRDIATLVDQGVQGIELNALATPEWAQVILEIQKRFGLILTMGSDNHGETTPHRTHGLLGQMNPYFLEDETRVAQHLKALRERVGV